MASFRSALAKIGEPGGDGKVPPFRSGFHTAPPSLRAAMAAMEDPNPGGWSMRSEEFLDESWTQNCQGVTWGAGHWFFACNEGFFGTHLGGGPRAIYKFQGLKQVGVLTLADSTADHLGELDHHGGMLYAALEGAPDSPHGSAVFAVDDNLEFSAFPPPPLLSKSGGKPAQGGSMPWCAIHPWNGLLYSSSFDDVKTVYAYERADDGYRQVPEENIELRSEPLFRVQGGCFSPGGHLYLAVDVRYDSEHKSIYVYSALNGTCRGRIPVLALEDNQELEGLCFKAMTIAGQRVELHVVLLEQQALATDNIFFKHYAAPDPARV